MEVKTQENTKEISAIEQWDAVAFKLIQQELAPKGYSEIKRGPWRGKVQSNIPFLPKQSVVNCQKIAAQMVRSYRGKVIITLADQIKKIDGFIAKDQADLKACGFLQFKKKAELKGNIRSLLGQAGALKWMVDQVDKLNIK